MGVNISILQGSNSLVGRHSRKSRINFSGDEVQ